MESMLVSKSNSPPHPRAHAFLHSDISTCVCIHGHTHAHTHRGYSLAEAPLGAWSPLSDTQAHSLVMSYTTTATVESRM